MKFNILGLFVMFTLLVMSCKESENKTPSGYAYTTLDSGTGDVPKTNDYVFFTIKISGDDGKVIQDMSDEAQLPSVQIPAEFPKGPGANPVIEILAVGKLNGHYKVQMPIDSIPNAPVDLQALKYIEYEIVIKRIENEEGYKKYMEEQQNAKQAVIAANMEKLPAIEELTKKTIADYNAGKLETKSLESGLKYYIVSEGTGENAKEGNNVSVQYYGSLLDGTMFDNSFSRGESFPFTLGTGQVIKGWDQGIPLLNVGAKAFLFIPFPLAYGEAGSPPTIPPSSDLVFYVELEKINK